MVYTITLNPAIDYVAFIPHLKWGEINRSSDEKIFFGGKGPEITTKDDVLLYAEKLRNMGAQNVLVSLGDKGAVLLDQGTNL